MNTKHSFDYLLHILSVEIYPVSYGSHEVTVYCYFEYTMQLCIYQLSKDVCDKLDVTKFYGYLSHTYHMSIDAADIIEAETETVKCPL
jgi:hypothetical protein